MSFVIARTARRLDDPIEPRFRARGAGSRPFCAVHAITGSASLAANNGARAIEYMPTGRQQRAPDRAYWDGV